MWNPFKRKPKTIIVLDSRKFTKEIAKEIKDFAKCPVILVRDINSIRIINFYVQTD